MSQFLVAYHELIVAPASPIPLLELHQIMTGAGAVDGLEQAKATVKAMAAALAAALAE